MSSPFDNTFEAVDSFVSANRDANINNQNATITTMTSGQKNPLWVSRYPNAEVTYPESTLLAWSVIATTGAASAGTAHTHPVSFDAGNVASAIVQFVAQNVSAGSYITISQPRVVDTVGFYVYKVAGTLNNTYLEIFRENSDTSLTQVSSTDISASIGTTLAWLEVVLSTPIVVQPGERWLLRIRNSSTVATQVNCIGVWRTSISPDASFVTTTSTDSTRTSYTAAQAASARAASIVFQHYAMATTGATVTPKSYSDDFNRATLGNLWRTGGGAVPFIDTTFSRVTNLPLSAIPASATLGWGVYTLPTVNDDALVEANVYSLGYFTSLVNAGVVLHATNDMSSGVLLYLDSANAKIYSGNPSGTSMTQRASITIPSLVDAKWSLYYNSATTTYTALCNGDPIGLSWVDASNNAGRTALTRYGGFRIMGSSISGIIPVPAPPIDNWTLKDYAS